MSSCGPRAAMSTYACMIRRQAAAHPKVHQDHNLRLCPSLLPADHLPPPCSGLGQNTRLGTVCLLRSQKVFGATIKTNGVRPRWSRRYWPPSAQHSSALCTSSGSVFHSKAQASKIAKLIFLILQTLAMIKSPYEACFSPSLCIFHCIWAFGTPTGINMTPSNWLNFC